MKSSCTYGAIWFFESHEVNYKASRTDEENLHAGVVGGDKIHEEVHISKAEHDEVDFLSFA